MGCVLRNETLEMRPSHTTVRVWGGRAVVCGPPGGCGIYGEYRSPCHLHPWPYLHPPLPRSMMEDPVSEVSFEGDTVWAHPLPDAVEDWSGAGFHINSRCIWVSRP